MEKILELIKEEKIDELRLKVFNQKLSRNSESVYTQVLTAEEETAFIQKLLTKTGYEADKWLEFIQEYNRHYPLSNSAVDVLLNNMDDPKSIPLLIDIFSTFGYNEHQGLELCTFVLQNLKSPETLRIMQLLCEYARAFSPDIYRQLEKMDMHIHETGYTEQAVFAASYKQVAENHAQQHIIE